MGRCAPLGVRRRIAMLSALLALAASATLVAPAAAQSGLSSLFVRFANQDPRCDGVGNDLAGQLYAIDLDTGAATTIGPRAIPLNGRSFGFDFNPVPDRLRIVSGTGQSMRINPNDGTVVAPDGALAYPAIGNPNSGRVARVVSVAYTNPDTDPQTNTVLYDLDAGRAAEPDRDGDILAIQVPPNAGTLNTVGAVRLAAGDLGGFDIGPRNDAGGETFVVEALFDRFGVGQRLGDRRDCSRRSGDGPGHWTWPSVRGNPVSHCATVTSAIRELQVRQSPCPRWPLPVP